MTSNPRQTRMTGLSDAAGAEPGDAKRPKTFLDKWVEPPLRAPAPSFMEYPHLDIARHGVLENMAPLGTMPSSKVKKMLKAEGPRRVTLVKKGGASLSATSTPREAVTPEPPGRRKSDSQLAEDAEWNPTTPLAQISARKSAALESIGRQSLPPHGSPYSMSASPTKQERDLQRMDLVVDIACREARAAGHFNTGYALRSLYDDHRSNDRIVKIMERIAAHEAKEEQQSEFQKLMKYKKKEGRTSGKTEQWLAQEEKDFLTAPVFFSDVNFNSPKKAAAETANDLASRSPHKDADGHIHKKHKGNGYEGQKNGTLEVNGNGNVLNGAHSRTRSNSMMSSDSDLSSLDEELLGGHRESFAPSQSPNQKQAAASRPDDSHPPARNNHAQPITQQQKSLGPKLHAWDTTSTNSVAPSASSSNTNTNKSTLSSTLANHNGNHTNMPVCLSDSFISQNPDPHPQQTSHQLPQHHSLKSLKKTANGITRESDENDRTLRLKRKAKDTTETRARIYESYDRYHAESDVEAGEPAAAANQSVKSGQVLRFRSSQASRKIKDESDDLSSPTLPSFQPDGLPGSSSNSRAGTPGALNRASRKPKSGLRMKTSPMKKKAGPSAGIPRASGERNSPVGNGAFSGNQDDNDDYCSSCGGNGDLVCCDGCTRSFHFRCVDPPLSESQLPDNWFCNACNASRNPRPNEDYSLFGQMLAILQKKNPSAFNLPKDIREYFEGVRTGIEGEYEEGVPQKPRRNAGYEEAPDYLKLKDAKGNFILCHECHEGAGNSNPIIPCSYCGLHWHLDCLDPPLANPPPVGKLWRCPCHVDDLLAKVPGTLGPAHRFRKIKGASVVKPAFVRGFRNDGNIEIEFAPSDDEDEGFFDQREYGRVYKLPEEGIKLDFISRVRGQVGQLAIPTPPPELSEAPIKQSFTAEARHSLIEQQAALNIAQFAAQTSAPDSAQMLIDALIAEASPSVLKMLAQADASNIASKTFGQRDKQSLLAMKALIEESLSSIEESGEAIVSNGAEVKDEVAKKEEDVEMLL